MSKVLVVYHSLSGNTRRMADAIAEGAKAVSGAEVVVKDGLDATIDDLLGCDGVAFGSPDYFSSLAGGMKDFFDRTFYPSQGKVTDKPTVLFGNAGGPATNILGALRKMAQIFKLHEVAEAVGASGAPTESVLQQCRQLGQALAEAARR